MLRYGYLSNDKTVRLQSDYSDHVHKIGFKEANWLIDKNALGIPLNRYKHRYIWARDGSDDHSYCHLYMVYLQQNYSGGGTYGQTFAKVFDDQNVGYP